MPLVRPQKGYPEEVISLGDHLRKARLDRGLFQKEVAKTIQVTTSSITAWELNHTQPELRYVPAIITFLGYNPRPIPSGTLEQLRWYKWTNGMSLERLGAAMGRSPEQLDDWLSGRVKPFNKSVSKINTFLKAALERDE